MATEETRPRRLVVKIGSSTLTTSASSIDLDYLGSLAGQLSGLREEGWQIVLVSSGAIACGLGRLGITERPTDMPSLQAAASVGQSELAAAYSDYFDPYGIITSLVLLTRRDTADRSAYLHARETLDRLLDLGVIPIVNENDTISVEQIKFGDNDSLAALVSCLIDADMLVIISDIDGLYDDDPTKNPDAKVIHTVNRIDRSIMEVAGGAGSVAGSGGMLTKIQAARIMMSAGIPMAIVNGKDPEALAKSVHGRCPGTMFVSEDAGHTITPRKLWLALGDNARGAIVIDDGAKKALIACGSSLLCVGARSVRGRFDEGEIVDIEDEEGVVVARGKVSASSDIIDLAIGKSRDELMGNRLLEHLATKPIVHRDELMLFE